jgi:two-component system NtrC family response regulator
MLLLVDDQADVRFLLGLFLQDEGLAFDEAASGPEALALVLAGERTYGAVLLDQRLAGGLSGVEVAEALRAAGDDVPVVLYSAFLDDAVAARAAALGVATVPDGAPERVVAAVRDALGATLPT